MSRLALRAFGAPLFIIGGALLILMSALGAAPSMWYFFCYCALPAVGIVWLWDSGAQTFQDFGITEQRVSEAIRIEDQTGSLGSV